MNFDTTAKLPGQPPARLTRRATEARTYAIDCAALLSEHELLVRVVSLHPSVFAADDLAVTSAWVEPSACTSMRLTLAGGAPPAGQAMREWPLLVTLKTNLGFQEVSLLVRVIADVK